MTHPNRVGGLLILTFVSVYGWLIQDITVTTTADEQFTARSMPIFICVMAGIFSLWLIINPGTSDSGETGKLSSLNWKAGIGFCMLMSIYGFTVRPAGFLLSTTCFLAVGFYLLGERRVGVAALVAGFVATGFWLLMSQVLGVYLPPLPSIFTSAPMGPQ